MLQKFPKKSKTTGDAKKLVARLDRVFSEFIRRRDSDSNGMCMCITCGRVHHWKEIHAGHFIQRDRKATRFSEENVNAQCCHCNSFRSGEQFEHGRMIDIKYGKGTAQKLKNLSMASVCKLDATWLMYYIDLYKKKIKELKNNC
jgi:hypothetical protein